MHFSHFSWYCIFLRIVYLLQIPVFIKNWQFVSYKNKWEIYFNSINFQKYLNSSSEEYHWSAVKWGIETNCKQNGSLGHQLLQWAFSSFCLRTTSVLGWQAQLVTAWCEWDHAQGFSPVWAAIFMDTPCSVCQSNWHYLRSSHFLGGGLLCQYFTNTW